MELGGVYVIIWFTTLISWENTLAVKLKRAPKKGEKKELLTKRERVFGYVDFITSECPSRNYSFP